MLHAEDDALTWRAHSSDEASVLFILGHNCWTEGQLAGIHAKKGQRHESPGQTARG